MNTGQVGDKSGRRHPTRRQVESSTTAANSATTSVKSATFANRIGDNFGHIGDNFWSNSDPPSFSMFVILFTKWIRNRKS